MSSTVRTTYRGWDITATCLKHSNSDPGATRRFTARAFAQLHDNADEIHWRDPRTQTVAIVDHIFGSADDCSQTLLARMKVIIDNLKTSSTPLAS